MNTENAITTWESPQTLAARINRMLNVQREVMKKDVDFGTVPGCGNKPTLLKPGAELLCTTFKVGDRMAPGYPQRDIDSYSGAITFTTVLEFYDQATGETIGQGLGVASTAEEKYAWRLAVCDEEFEAAEDDQKRLKWKKGYGNNPPEAIKQIRTNPKDLENTVAKMSKKRAKVDGTLNVLAASRVFAQDLEDLPEGLDTNDSRPQSTKPHVEPTRAIRPDDDTSPDDATRKANKWISSGQEKRLYAIAKEAKVSIKSIKNWLKIKYGKEHIYQITWAGKQYDSICKTIEEKPEFFKDYGEAPRQSEPVPQVLDQEEFEGLVLTTAKQIGYEDTESFLTVLKENLGYNSLADVPADKQSEVVDFFDAILDGLKNSD